jgi:hypothetical protein
VDRPAGIEQSLKRQREIVKKKAMSNWRGTEQRYAMIEELSVQFGVEQCCVALSVSRSGYYQWAATEQSLRAEANAELLKQIERVYHQHKGTARWDTRRPVSMKQSLNG